jgi:hypothetical protein
VQLASGISNLGFNLVQQLEKDRESEEYESECESEIEKTRKSEDKTRMKATRMGVMKKRKRVRPQSIPVTYPLMNTLYCTNLEFILNSWISCCRSL